MTTCSKNLGGMAPLAPLVTPITMYTVCS